MYGTAIWAPDLPIDTWCPPEMMLQMICTVYQSLDQNDATINTGIQVSLFIIPMSSKTSSTMEHKAGSQHIFCKQGPSKCCRVSVHI